MQISADMIKQLREKTGAGVMECKKVLTEAEGNVDKAQTMLTERGIAKALKKADRVADQGLVECYVHMGGKIGVMVEINCETDFVAHTDEFQALAHEIALQIAAMSPQYISSDEIASGDETDPKTVCLLHQPFIKDPTKSIQDLITETIAKVGENVKIRRFARFELGY